VFEKRVLRGIFGCTKDEVTGGRRRLHNVELHSLCSSPNIIRVVKSRTVRWVEHAARMGEINAYKIVVEKLDGDRSLGRPRRKWENYIKMILVEAGVCGFGLDPSGSGHRPVTGPCVHGNKPSASIQ
jgi:hypothetical protein